MKNSDCLKLKFSNACNADWNVGFILQASQFEMVTQAKTGQINYLTNNKTNECYFDMKKRIELFDSFPNFTIWNESSSHGISPISPYGAESKREEKRKRDLTEINYLFVLEQ